jgi:hypothetical protein
MGGPHLLFQASSNSHLVESSLIPGRFDNRTEIAGVLRREFIAVADGEDAMPRLKPKQECWESNGDRQRLEMARRQVDNEPGDLTAANPFQLIRDRGYVPVRQVR